MSKVHAKLEDKDKGFLELMRRLRQIRTGRVKVGVLASSSKGGAHHGNTDTEAVTQGKTGSLTVAQIAAILEFGTEDGHIPKRPAMGITFDKMHPELVEMGKKLIEAVLGGGMEAKDALNILGAKLANGIKRTITAGTGVPPPNAPSTIKRKGSSRPWVDTGRVVNAFTWSVQMGDEKDAEDEDEKEST